MITCIYVRSDGVFLLFFFFQAEDGIRDLTVTGVQTCALPIYSKAAANAPLLYDVQTGLQAFCRGAGIDAERLPADAQTRLLHLAGQLFREALVGFKDLERTQSEIRNRFRIEIPPPEPDDPRPSLPRLTVEELLVGLLTQHESRSLDAVQWLRETVPEAKAHDSAAARSEEHTSELQSQSNLVCRLLLEKNKTSLISRAHTQN